MDSRNPLQTQQISDTELVQQYERQTEILLRKLQAWTRLPTERTDWELEELLSDLGDSARVLRQLRGDADLPF